MSTQDYNEANGHNSHSPPVSPTTALRLKNERTNKHANERSIRDKIEQAVAATPIGERQQLAVYVRRIGFSKELQQIDVIVSPPASFDSSDNPEFVRLFINMHNAYGAWDGFDFVPFFIVCAVCGTDRRRLSTTDAVRLFCGLNSCLTTGSLETVDIVKMPTCATHDCGNLVCFGQKHCSDECKYPLVLFGERYRDQSISAMLQDRAYCEWFWKRINVSSTRDAPAEYIAFVLRQIKASHGFNDADLALVQSVYDQLETFRDGQYDITVPRQQLALAAYKMGIKTKQSVECECGRTLQWSSLKNHLFSSAHVDRRRIRTWKHKMQNYLDAHGFFIDDLNGLL